MQHSVTFSLLLAGILTQGLAASSQRPAFGVYYTAGTINCIPARGPSRPVLAHSWLYQGDKITLLDNLVRNHPLRPRYQLCPASRQRHLYNRGDRKNAAYPRPGHDPHPLSRVIVGRSHPTGASQPRRRHPKRTALPNAGTPAPHSPALRNPSPVLAPRPGYATSMDSLIFRWHSVYWARKYFLRLRSPDGRLCYDSVLVDTQAVVHFPGRMTAGNSYTWTLDIVGESGRLQFADSNHIVLVNDTAVLPQLPPITPDSIGGFAVLLQRIEQYENAGCIKAG